MKLLDKIKNEKEPIIIGFVIGAIVTFVIKVIF